MTDLVVEHRESTFSRRLRRHRIELAAVVAAVEAVLVLSGVVPWWLVLVAAVAATALYLAVGRDHAASGVRSATWVAAASQLIVVLVPVGIVLIGLLALVGIAVLAAAALAILLLERR